MAEQFVGGSVMFRDGLRSSCAQFEQVSTSIRNSYELFFLYTTLQTVWKCPGDFVTDLTKTSKCDDSVE